MRKDLISKDIIKSLLEDIAKYFLNIDIKDKKIRFLDKEFGRIEKREADIVANINDEYILHLEIQNANDKKMSKRMLRYYTDILEITDLPINQYVVYIGKNKANFETKLERDLLNYSYNFVDIHTIDCEVLLSQDSPEALVLAILCDFKNKNPKDIVQYIINKLYEYANDDSNNYRKYIMMLEVLSENRNLKEIVKESEMLRTVTYQDLPSWEIGFEQGITQGIAQGSKKERSRTTKIIIINSLKKGLDEELIQEITGVDLETINRIKEELKN